MNYNKIRKDKKSFVNMALILGIVFSLYIIYQAKFWGLCLILYYFAIVHYAKKDIKKRDSINFKNTEVLFYKKVSPFKVMAEHQEFVMLVFPSIFLLYLTLMDLDKSETLSVFLIGLVMFLVLVTMLLNQYRYIFIAFDEGFMSKGTSFNYTDIKKYQMIKMKSDHYILDMAGQKGFTSIKLTSDHAQFIEEKLKVDQS